MTKLQIKSLSWKWNNLLEIDELKQQQICGGGGLPDSTERAIITGLDDGGNPNLAKKYVNAILHDRPTKINIAIAKRGSTDNNAVQINP